MKEKYPTIDCKEACLNTRNCGLPFLFFVCFGISAIVFIFVDTPFIDEIPMNKTIYKILISLVPLIISLVGLIIMIRSINTYINVKRNGTEFDTKVIGYRDDNTISFGETGYHGIPGKTVELLMDTDTGKKVLLYQLYKPDKIYEIDSIVRVKVYNNTYLIVK